MDGRRGGELTWKEERTKMEGTRRKGKNESKGKEPPNLLTKKSKIAKMSGWLFKKESLSKVKMEGRWLVPRISVNQKHFRLVPFGKLCILFLAFKVSSFLLISVLL